MLWEHWNAGDTAILASNVLAFGLLATTIGLGFAVGFFTRDAGTKATAPTGNYACTQDPPR